MTTLQRGLVKDYVRRLRSAKTLLAADDPPPDMSDQVTAYIDDVLDGLEAHLKRIVWPVPTVDEPDFETLENWMIEDGGCEATDGCWVEPDGTCQHGHPSWFLVLGLV